MATVISSGQLVNLRSPYANPSTGWGSIALYGEHYSDYATIFKTQSNVRRVTGFLAKNIAQLGIKAYERVSDSERRHLGDHPVEKLLRSPNDIQTGYAFKRQLVYDLTIYDSAYIVKIRVGGKVTGLLPIPPAWMRFDGKTPFWASGYNISVGGREYEVPDTDVIHIHGYHPTDPRQGLSPMETLRRQLAELDAAGRFREAFWRNNARQETVITRPKDAPAWSETARKRFIKDWREQYAGPDKAGQTPVLEEGMDVKVVSQTAKDAEYIPSLKFALEEVCGLYGVSPPLVGLLDEANFGSQTAIYRQWLSTSLAPWTVDIEEEFELKLLREFEPPGAPIYLEFNLQEKLKGSFEEEANQLQTAVGGPWMTRDEARARRNLPPMGGDATQLIMPLNVTAGSPAETSEPKASPSLAYQNVLRNHLERQEKALSRVSLSDARLLFDRKRWEQELTKDLLVLGSGDPSKRLGKAQEVAAAVNGSVVECLEGAGSITEAMVAARVAVLGGE